MKAGIYKGTKDAHYYIEIPKKLDWNAFYELITSLRGTGNFPSFDAAMISLYTQDSIIEFVRVYSKSCNEDDLLKLKTAIIKHI